jgi:L-2-hydroxyglutarate oxidase LhgO
LHDVECIVIGAGVIGLAVARAMARSGLQSLLADAEAAGASIAYGTAVASLTPTAAGIEMAIDKEPSPVVRAQLVVNCAGLHAHQVAASIEGFPTQFIPQIRYAKGSYFALSGASHLISVFQFPRIMGRPAS